MEITLFFLKVLSEKKGKLLDVLFEKTSCYISLKFVLGAFLHVLLYRYSQELLSSILQFVQCGWQAPSVAEPHSTSVGISIPK